MEDGERLPHMNVQRDRRWGCGAVKASFLTLNFTVKDGATGQSVGPWAHLLPQPWRGQ